MKQTVFSFLFISLACSCWAQPAGWTTVVPIDITNNSTSTGTDIQVSLNIDTQTPIAAGNMQSNGEDIRFGSDCSGTTLYPYWIESGINTGVTTIWIKIDNLPASATKTIYMYYGNSGATAVSAVSGTFVGPHSATDSVASGGAGGATNSQRGFRFTPTQDLLVTSFGKREPNGTPRYVTLFNFSTQALLQQIQVSGAAAEYHYASLASPIWLSSGTQYILTLYQGSSDGYYFGSSSQIGQHLTYGDMRYCNSCTENTFPTNVLTNYHYGYPDLWYFTKNSLSPAPSVSVGTAPQISITGLSAICEGDNNTLTASGMSTYVWSTTETTAAISVAPTASTSYTVTGTDVAGCHAEETFMVNVNSLPLLSFSGNTSICQGSSTTLTVSGASTYAWSSGGNTDTEMLGPSATATYTVSAIDANNCANIDSVTVNVNQLPLLSFSGNTSICQGSSTTLTVSGAATYAWSSGGNTDTEMLGPSATATYTVSAIDANNCANIDSVTVIVNTPSLSFSGNTSVCEGSPTTLTVSGATTYAWSSGGNTDTEVVSPNTTTTYTVSATDANNCSVIDSVTVVTMPLPTVDLGADATVCDGVSLDAGAGFSAYLWNDNSTAQTLTVTASATYSVSVVDANGCIGEDDITLSVTTLTLSASQTAALCFGESSGTATADVSGGTTPYTYVWNTGGTTATISGLFAGNYTVTATDANGCEEITSVIVTEANNLTASVSTVDASCSTCANGIAAVIVSGGTSPYTYLWSDGSIIDTRNDLLSGTYTVTITDGNGCEIVETVIISFTSNVSGVDNFTANVYPNPTESQLVIELNAHYQDVSLSVFDATGKKVLSQVQNNMQQTTLDLSGIPAGVYMLQIRQGQSNGTSFKFVKI